MMFKSRVRSVARFLTRCASRSPWWRRAMLTRRSARLSPGRSAAPSPGSSAARWWTGSPTSHPRRWTYLNQGFHSTSNCIQFQVCKTRYVEECMPFSKNIPKKVSKKQCNTEYVWKCEGKKGHWYASDYVCITYVIRLRYTLLWFVVLQNYVLCIMLILRFVKIKTCVTYFYTESLIFILIPTKNLRHVLRQFSSSSPTSFSESCDESFL